MFMSCFAVSVLTHQKSTHPPHPPSTQTNNLEKKNIMQVTCSGYLNILPALKSSKAYNALELSISCLVVKALGFRSMANSCPVKTPGQPAVSCARRWSAGNPYVRSALFVSFMLVACLLHPHLNEGFAVPQSQLDPF